MDCRIIFWKLFLLLILIIHICLILFVVIIPFTNDNFLLFIHTLIVPFIVCHWLINDNNCSLTTIEKMVRKKIYGETDFTCFTCKLIEPVYDFNKTFGKYGMDTFLYIITLLLIIIVIFKLCKKVKDKKIKNFYHLLECNTSLINFTAYTDPHI